MSGPWFPSRVSGTCVLLLSAYMRVYRVIYYRSELADSGWRGFGALRPT